MKIVRVLFFCLSLALFPLLGIAAGVNINAADVAALQQLNGVGPAKAQAIVDHRDANGPFASVDDLASVSGIGPRTVEVNRPLLSVDDAE